MQAGARPVIEPALNEKNEEKEEEKRWINAMQDENSLMTETAYHYVYYYYYYYNAGLRKICPLSDWNCHEAKMTLDFLFISFFYF